MTTPTTPGASDASETATPRTTQARKQYLGGEIGAFELMERMSQLERELTATNEDNNRLSGWKMDAEIERDEAKRELTALRSADKLRAGGEEVPSAMDVARSELANLSTLVEAERNPQQPRPLRHNEQLANSPTPAVANSGVTEEPIRRFALTSWLSIYGKNCYDLFVRASDHDALQAQARDHEARAVSLATAPLVAELDRLLADASKHSMCIMVPMDTYDKDQADLARLRSENERLTTEHAKMKQVVSEVFESGESPKVNDLRSQLTATTEREGKLREALADAGTRNAALEVGFTDAMRLLSVPERNQDEQWHAEENRLSELLNAMPALAQQPTPMAGGKEGGGT